MIIVSNWADSDIIDKETKTCDNKDVGDIKEVNKSFVIVRDGDRVLKIPRGAVATFDGGKLYLRATEAEVLAGIYPFVSSDQVDWSDANATGMNDERLRDQKLSPASRALPQDR